MLIKKYKFNQSEIDLNSNLFQGVHDIIKATIGANTSSENILGEYLCAPKPTQCIIWAFYKETKMVGFCFLTTYQLNNIIILRFAVSILGAFRNKFKIPYADFIQECCILKFKQPFKKILYFSNPINPYTYAKLHKYANHFYEDENNPKIRKYLDTVYELFEMKKYVKIRKTPYRLEQLNINWHAYAKRNKHVEYFIEKNPNFQNGNGLITIIPLNLSNLWHALICK